jgi:type III secretory pathway component EscV
MTVALQSTPLGPVLTVGHEMTQALVVRIRAQIAARANTAIVPVVLTTQALRRPLRQLLADELFETPILSYAELSPMQRVQVLATLSRESEPTAAA